MTLPSAQATVLEHWRPISVRLVLIKQVFLQLEEERLAAIDRENHILLDRMTRIVNSKGNCYNDYERGKRHATYITCVYM